MQDARAATPHLAPPVPTPRRIDITPRFTPPQAPPVRTSPHANHAPSSEDAAADQRTHWLSISAAIASISVVGIAIGVAMPLLSVILESRGHSASMIGLNTAVAGLASIAAAPFATPLAARFGVVWTMLAMIVVGAFSVLGFFFAPSFWMWFPLRAMLHVALTVLFILSEFWISMRRRRAGAAWCSASMRRCCRSASLSAPGSMRRWAAAASCRSASPSRW